MKDEQWRLKNVRMTGLLNRHDICWQLSPKVNILGGENGSGKSTILHALAIALMGSPDSNMAIHCAALFKELTVELESGDSVVLQRDAESTRTQLSDPSLAADGKLHIKVEEKIRYKRKPMPVNGSGTVQSAGHVIYVNSSDHSLRSVKNLLDISGEGGRPSATVLDLQLENALNSRNRIFAERMSAAMLKGDEAEVSRLRELFGRFDEAVKVFMKRYILEDAANLRFAPEDDPQTEILRFNLSTGEKQLLFLLLTVANTLGEPTVLLLDEADTGLHVDWKKILLRQLLAINPEMQIIACTHSPSLIDGWYDNVREVSQLYCKVDAAEGASCSAETMTEDRSDS